MARRQSGVALIDNRRRVSGFAGKTAPPLAYDATSTGWNTANKNTQVASQASSAFSPLAGAVLIVQVMAIGNNSNAHWVPPVSVTDSLGTPLTYTPGPAWDSPSTNGFATSIWTAWAYVGLSAPGSMTVTATISTNAGQNVQYMGVQVSVWDNALTTGPFGASANGNTPAAQNVTIPLTPTTLGSALAFVVVDGAFTGAITAGTGAYAVNHDGAPLGTFLWYGTSAGPTLTTALNSVNLDAVCGSTGAVPAWVAYEVLPA